MTQQSADKPSVVKDLRYGDLCPRCNAASGIDTCGSPDDECPISVDVLPENYYIPRAAVPETGLMGKPHTALMREHADYMASYNEPFVGSTDAIARALRTGADRIDQLERELAERTALLLKTQGDLIERNHELFVARSASGSNWQHFDAAYAKACESSEPKDWMQAALFAQQVRNAVSTIQPSSSDRPHQHERNPEDWSHCRVCGQTLPSDFVSATGRREG